MQVIKRAELTDKEVKAINSLTVSQKSFITALIDSKLLVLSKEDCTNTIYQALKVAEIDSGMTKIDNKDLVQLSFSIHELIEDKYKNLTISELKIAFKNGVIGTYGQWFGMCLKTVNEWIKGYLNNEGRINAIKEWNAKILKEETSDKPIHEINMFNKESSIRAFEHFKLTGSMPNASFAYYDIINELIGVDYNGKKTLIPDLEVRKKLVSECENLYSNLLLKEKKRNEVKGNLQESEKLIDLIIDPKGLKGLERMTKEVFLKYYFNKLISENKRLEL